MRAVHGVKSKSNLLYDEIDEIADPLKSQLNMQDQIDEYESIDNYGITFQLIFFFFRQWS